MVGAKRDHRERRRYWWRVRREFRAWLRESRDAVLWTLSMARVHDARRDAYNGGSVARYVRMARMHWERWER